MNKETHWLAQSLSDHLHCCDKIQKAADKEIEMWRKRYLEQEMFDDSEYTRECFINLPTTIFLDPDFPDNPDDIVNKYCRLKND